MQPIRLGKELVFPSPLRAGPDGLLAYGGDLSPERLVLAYSQGIFPWPTRGYPLLWFSPDPRFVVRPARVHLSRSLRKRLRRTSLSVRTDQDFASVIEACAAAPRPGQDGTWITPALERAYVALHEQGYAHSVEAYREGALVGGLYGVSLGRVFFGESMFAREPDASKVAFATLLAQLLRWDFPLVDCQVETAHLARFGAFDLPREEFLGEVVELVSAPTKLGPWALEVTPAEVDALLSPR